MRCISISGALRRRWQLTPMMLVMTTACMLSGCGGGGSEVASIATPPPAPASPPPAAPAISPAPVAGSLTVNQTTYASPATRSGTYDTIAIVEHGGSIPGPVSNRLAAPGEIRILTYQSTSVANEVVYTLELANADLPEGRSVLEAVLPPREVVSPPGIHPFGNYTLRFGEQLLVTSDQGHRLESSYLSGSNEATRETIADGREFGSQLSYNTGLSSVSLGQWNWWVSDTLTGNRIDSNSVYFVHGDRTPPSDIPPSGTATYSGASLGAIGIALAAEFAQRSITAQLSRDSQIYGDSVGGYTTVTAIDAHGTGQINSPGDFSIPLSGTVGFPGDVSGSISRSVPATGSLDGAFFGPNAQQVGGVFVLGEVPGQPLVSDAFVGTRD